jgi:hypothetical protein
MAGRDIVTPPTLREGGRVASELAEIGVLPPLTSEQSRIVSTLTSTLTKHPHYKGVFTRKEDITRFAEAYARASESERVELRKWLERAIKDADERLNLTEWLRERSYLRPPLTKPSPSPTLTPQPSPPSPPPTKAPKSKRAKKQQTQQTAPEDLNQKLIEEYFDQFLKRGNP